MTFYALHLNLVGGIIGVGPSPFDIEGKHIKSGLVDHFFLVIDEDFGGLVVAGEDCGFRAREVERIGLAL